LNSNVGDWLQKPLLEIDTVMLLERYRGVMERIKLEGAQLEARYSKMLPAKRLLVSKPGYYNGIKAALDTVICFGRVYRYWTRKHARQLAKAGVIVPES